MVIELSIIGACDKFVLFFFLMIRRPPRSTLDRSSAASDVYKRQVVALDLAAAGRGVDHGAMQGARPRNDGRRGDLDLSLIHISEPTRPY